MLRIGRLLCTSSGLSLRRSTRPSGLLLSPGMPFSSGASAAPLKFSIDLVKQLRELTSAPIKDCKDALQQVIADGAGADGDSSAVMQSAVEELRKRGVDLAAKKAGRTAAQGLVALATDVGAGAGADAQRVAVVEVNCETDFVSMNEKFQGLCSSVAHSVLSARGLALGPGGHVDAHALVGLRTPAGPSVAGSVTELVAAIRENIQVRRGALQEATAPNEVLATYVHNATGPAQGGVQLGKIGCVLKLVGGPEVDCDEVRKTGSKIAMHMVAMNPPYVSRDSIPEADLEHEKQILRDQAKQAGKPDHVVEKMIQGKLNRFYEENVLVDQRFVLHSGDDKPPKIADMLAALPGKPQLASVTKFVVGEGIEQQDQSGASFAEEVAQLAQS